MDGVAGYRASPQQREQWLGLDLGRPSAWHQLIAQVEGPVDAERLQVAVRGVFMRHEILRTRLQVVAGQRAPIQVIDEAEGGLADVHRLHGDPELQATVDALAEEERARVHPVDGPVLRVVLVTTDGERSALIVTGHSIVVDRRSLRLVLAEIADLYASGSLSPVAVQYADYAAWHHDLLHDDARATRRAFWDAQLEPGPCDPTTGQPQPVTGERAQWRSVRRRIPSETAKRLAKLGPDLAGGESSMVTAAWAILQWRRSGERDVRLAVTLARRPYPELERAVGAFAGDVPLVARFAADWSFQAAATSVDEALHAAAEHAEDLDPARLRGLPATARFEYVEPHPPAAGTDPVFRPVRELSRGSAGLLLRSGSDESGPWLELFHDGPGPELECADDLLARLLAVLDAGTREPGRPIGTMSLLLPGEGDCLLSRSQGPAPVTPTAATLHGAVDAQARRTPDAVAVDDGLCRLTYAELQRHSDAFARALTASGVRPGDRLVLFMDRSTELLVALLAVLKTGAAFVPLDTRQPAERLAFMLADVSATVLVASARAEVPEVSTPVVRCALGSDAEPAGTTDAEPPASLAYVMYTSGSTGSPNGVPVTHAALLNYLQWATDAYDLRSGSGSLVDSPIGFDLTLTGLLAPLLVGQRVTLVPESPGLSGLVSALRAADDVTLLKLTPSQLDALVQVVAPAELAARVRTLVLGGEQLRAETLSELRAAGTSLRIVNEYGPTETVVGSAAHEVGPETPSEGPVPIGTPIAGTWTYLLDAAWQLVPDGVPGEIVIGGPGVSAGYLNREELTAQRFVPDLFAADGVCYRTGDRARRLPSGDLVYLGRLDDQIKVRGIRVEPSEIEATLRSHPGVADAAVVQSGGSPGGQLVAYVVPAAGYTGPSSADLEGLCRRRLPSHMVPSRFVAASELPVTAQGKLDRGALSRRPAPAAESGHRTAPRTDTEEILAAAIASVLGLDEVGIDEDYFVIGGDSIRSIMVASRAQARGLDVSVADLHRNPSVRRLAEALAAGAGGVPEPHPEPFGLISPEDRALMPPDVEDAFPLNLLQEGMIFHRAFAAKSAVYHAIASVRLRAPLDVDVMRDVVHQLIERHPMLRTSFDQATFSRPLQLVHRAFKDPLSYEDLRGLDDHLQQARIEGWVNAEKQRGFELDDHPLIRFMVQPLNDETFQFTYGFHHEIVDGWSEALMVTELFDHYFSVVFGEPLRLPAPRSSMRDAVALELDALQRPENYDFWSRYLDDVTLMRLPRADSTLTADTGAREIERIAVGVSASLSASLKQLAVAQAVPLKSVLLAAHMAVMSHYHGQEDTLTYTVTNGRPETSDGSTAIGLFVNSLALRLRLAGGTWTQLIEATLDSERQSLPYRRLPMAELKRHQGNEPLAETLFFFTDYHVFRALDRWRARGVDHVASELYGESTFPFCAIFRLNRDTAQLEVRIEYDSLQFSAELMDEISECYVRVLEAMVRDPESRYDTEPLLAPAERHRLIDRWNEAGAAPGGDLMPELIRRQARLTPDAVAVESGDSALTFAGLERVTDCVAAALRARGAGPETLVGVLAHRGVETYLCLVGILKAGAAFLPLDPAQPDDRLARVVDLALPCLVLAEPAHTGRVGGVPVIGIEPGLPFADEVQPAAPGGPPAPEQAAYVLFTSGSTGEPKGVVVTHRGLASSTRARDRVYDGPPDRFLLLSSLAVDSSVVGLFWPLVTGGTLVLPPEGAQLDPAVLARTVRQRQATHTLSVPSLLAALLDAAQPGSLGSLRVVIAAGEACPRELYDDRGRVLPGCGLVNEYGPTENTVWSTSWTGEPRARRPWLPIGTPVPGSRAYVLNPHLQPVPVGVAAELYLAGAGLARGYLGRPGPTAGSFLPDPFALEPGARMYHSGDVARHTGEGDLEFMGRLDHQVKIRGFRVEPGEIEGVLDAHPDVSRALVVVRESSTGEPSLVAYVALQRRATVDVTQLQDHVRARLPKYMVPSAVILLDAIPLTPAGKVDRTSLPDPERGFARQRPVVGPRTDTEQVLAAIWSQALDVALLDTRDDFFALGGESLRAMKVVTRTNKVFGLDLSVRALFSAPTIASFGRAVDEARAARPT